MTAETASGNQTAIIDTEHTLATITAAGVYQLNIDANALLDGDILVLRVYLKTRSTSTSRVAFLASFRRGNPVLMSPPVPTAHEVKFTLEQTDGTARSFDWSVVVL